MANMLHGFPHHIDGQARAANPGRNSRINLALPVLIALTSCSTIAAPKQPSPQASAAAARPKGFVCRAFARPDPYSQPVERWDGVWGQPRPLGEIRLTDPGDRTVSSDTFRFRVLYDREPGGGSSLDILVYLKANGRLVQQTKFEFRSDSGPSTDLLNGHGFTGLHYVYASESREELQYWCSGA